jgi:hypothetical protein
MVTTPTLKIDIIYSLNQNGKKVEKKSCLHKIYAKNTINPPPFNLGSEKIVSKSKSDRIFVIYVKK